MRDIDTTYLVHIGDDYPPSVTMFEPGYDPHRVVFSQHRFGVFSTADGYNVEEFDDEQDALDAWRTLMMDEGHASIVDGEFEVNEDVEDDLPYDVRDAQWYAPSWFTDGEFGSRWVSTDAWRGYSQVTHNGQWEEYAGGWVTGYPDDTVRHKMTAADLLEALTNGDIEPPFPIVWFFGVTSNVFSTSSDILIPAGHGDEFEAWLTDETAFDPEAVERAFH